MSQILVHVHQPHGLRFSTTAFHFLVSLLCMKCMLPTIVSNKYYKTLLLCIIRVLKEHTSFLMTTLKGSRPLLIKFSDILALCCSPINVPVVGYFQPFKSFNIIWGPQWSTIKTSTKWLKWLTFHSITTLCKISNYHITFAIHVPALMSYTCIVFEMIEAAWEKKVTGKQCTLPS